ncbi:hypothetical protein ACFV27_37395 [Streptomyces antimycoticus]|uniref:hypothetical protein n=1 Tax=Streptomyces antimycoticus TaxID=68175 RepID=UPI00368DD739
MAANIGAELADIKKRLARIERGSRLASASIENTAVRVYDDSGSLRAIVGQQADGTTAVNVTNGPVPPTPSAPTVSPELAALKVTWDGTFTDAQAAPLDWMRVEVHVGATSGFTPDQSTLRDTIETPQGGSVIIPLPYTEWWVRMRCRTTSGAAGPATAGVAGTPRQAGAADIVAGAITADKLDAAAITGKTITGGTVTGATIQTAASGARVTLDTAMKVYNSAGDLLAQAVPDTTSLGYPNDCGFVAFNTVGIGRYWAMLSRGFIRFGREGSTYPWPPLIDHYISGGTVSILELTSGTVGPTADLGQAYLTMVGSPDGGTTPPRIQIHGDASGSRCDLDINGMMTAKNIVTGSVNITPSAANAPTSANVTGLNLPGTVHRAFVSAQSAVPGTVTEVTANNVTATGLTVWLSRTNTTTTNIWYLVIAS